MPRRPSKTVEVSWRSGARPIGPQAARSARPVDFRQSQVERLAEWGRLLDEAFRIPGTRIRFGWDPILSLFPGVGELATAAYSVVLIAQGFRLRVPKIVQLRMLLNVLIDMGISVIPVLGSAADIFWKSNVWNLRLLERHAQPGTTPNRHDWIFVVAVLGLALGIMMAPVVLVLWVFWKFGLL